MFTEPVKLLKLELMGVGHEMPTKFEANSEAMVSYRIETPAMHPGEFTVNWAVIGADGHAISNSFSFTVDPNATDAVGADHGHGAAEGHRHGAAAQAQGPRRCYALELFHVQLPNYLGIRQFSL